MRAKGRGADRSFRHGRALLLGALTLLGACAGPADGRRAGNANPAPDGVSGDERLVEPEILRHYVKQLREYIDALLILNSPNALDWKKGKRTLEILSPFHVFDEDPELIERFRNGSDPARRELGRRGVALHSIMVFYDPFDRKRWEDARKALLALGEPGKVLITRTLIGILLNGQYQNVWVHIRYNLVETGPFALETVVAVANEVAKRTPANMPVFRFDDLTQLLLVIIGFGDLGRPHFRPFATHPKANVRRAVSKALGEALDDVSLPTLIGYVERDPDWTVRTQAAQALGRMKTVWKEAGKVLTARLYKERDRTVRGELLLAIGDLNYYPAIPDLMKALKIPSLRTTEKVMIALYRITGYRANRKEKWQAWYKERYPDWLRRRLNRP